MNILKYKDFEGSAELDMERQICRGKLLFIDDLVTYEAASPTNLQIEFEAAVDDYLETCKSLGRDPKRPLKGLFNVRTPPELHRELHLRSLQDQCSLNETVVRACQAWVLNRALHHIRVTLEDSSTVSHAIRYGSDQPIQFENLSNIHEFTVLRN
ncbi:MAG: type II toxin-antitoxin system HicB family antitoxin [Gammaproteobacteria bacterium]|nr:type II toxin-antitoxin system HicB family antitoxin [Gammaproteobacteria bacterium]